MNLGERIETGSAGVLAPGRWLWLRAIGWMVLLFAVVLLAVDGVPLFDVITHRPVHTLPLLWSAPIILLAYAAYTAVVWFGERRGPVELSLGPAPLDLAAGLVVGLAMFSAVFLTLRLIGVYTLAPSHLMHWPQVVADNLLTGLIEELLLRAIVFRLLIRAFGISPALALSAALFGAMHLLNPNATLVAAAAIAVEAGLMLAAFYMLTGRLWMSIGVHAAWNFAQGSIFGARVSGLTMASSFYVSGPVPGSPEILSGGAFGPEASLPAMIVGTAVFAAVIAYLARQTSKTAQALG